VRFASTECTFTFFCQLLFLDQKRKGYKPPAVAHGLNHATGDFPVIFKTTLYQFEKRIGQMGKGLALLNPYE